MNSPDASWPTKRLRFLTTIPQKGETGGIPDETEVSFVPMEAISENGEIEASRTKAIGEVRNGYSYFAEGDIVLAKITPCFENGKGAIATDLINGVGFGTTELHVIRAGPGLDARFLFYVTKSHPFRKQGEAEMYGAGGQKRVPESFVRDFRVHVPGLDQQRAIADFLDRQTLIVDQLAAVQWKLVQALQVRRALLITAAVWGQAEAQGSTTTGNLPIVPYGWSVQKFKRLAFFQEGPGLRNWQFTDDGVRVICVTNITESGIDFGDYTKFISDEEYRGQYRHFTVQDGDLLLSSSGNSWGKVAEFRSDGIPTILNTSTIRVNELSSRPLSRKFIRWVLQTTSVREQLRLAMTGACQPNFGPTHLADLRVPVPPHDVQESISAQLESSVDALDVLISKISTCVAKIEELRSSLISAAVTGQIDVRNYRPQEAAVLCQ
jgi:type I restriction enzyme, S subunit